MKHFIQHLTLCFVLLTAVNQVNGQIGFQSAILIPSGPMSKYISFGGGGELQFKTSNLDSRLCLGFSMGKWAYQTTGVIEQVQFEISPNYQFYISSTLTDYSTSMFSFTSEYKLREGAVSPIIGMDLLILSNTIGGSISMQGPFSSSEFVTVETGSMGIMPKFGVSIQLNKSAYFNSYLGRIISVDMTTGEAFNAWKIQTGLAFTLFDWTKFKLMKTPPKKPQIKWRSPSKKKLEKEQS